MSEKVKSTIISSLNYCSSINENAEILDVGNGDEWIFSNIFDILITSYKIGLTPNRLYRGQVDQKWKLIPSYYRTKPQKADNIYFQAQRGQKNYLKKNYSVNLENLRDIEQQAVIQHYFGGTKLLDFTSSIYIAAFFATRVIEGQFPDIGAIYLISKTEIENELHIAKVKTIDIHENFERIHRQQGVFLSIEYQQLINQKGLLDRWLFYHTNESINLEFEPFKITKEWLFPELNPYPR